MSESIEGKTAIELLSMGTKSYWLHKYQDSAAYLSKSSEMLVEEHKDDKHDTLGNVYLYYGKSLLELAREDGDPLGDGVPKEVGMEDEEEEDEEGEEGEEGADKTAEEDKMEENEEKTDGEKADGGDAMETNASDVPVADISMNGEPASSTSNEEAKKTKDAEADEVDVDADAEADADADENEEAEEEEEDAGEGGSGEQKEEDEEPSDLQLAWEVLELAKVILERRGEEGREDYSDCLITLGEVSLESENFDSAISDITAGLEIQKQIYGESKDCRKLAQTYYKLGMALTAHNKIDEGIANYETTLKLLKERLTVLQAIPSPGVSDAEEVKDINSLSPELEEKIADLKNYKEEAAKKDDDEEPTLSSPEKKATNITHLVKRKRKLEDVAEEAAANAAKKSASQ